MPTDEAIAALVEEATPPDVQSRAGGLSGFILSDLDQELGGNAKSLVQSPDHIECELAPAIKHLMHTITAADKGDKIARLQSALFHVVSDRLSTGSGRSSR